MGSPFLPPVQPAVVMHLPYDWCQVRSVFARELARAAGKRGDPAEWAAHYGEAWDASEALRAAVGDRGALGMGAPEGLAYWPDVVCLAYTYAQHTPEQRRQLQAEIRAGRLLPAPFLFCDRAAAYDEAYYPEPRCYPQEAVEPLAYGLGAVLAGVVVGLLVRWATSSSAPPPAPGTALEVGEGRSYLDRLVTHYGRTYAPNLGGFLLPDGSFLDFSGGSGSRAQDHRNVNWVLPRGTERERESRYDGMVRVAKRVGMYRWMPESWSVEAWTPPTPEQRQAINELASQAFDQGITIEAWRGKRHFYREYEPWDDSRQPARDLADFYRGLD